MRGIAFAALLTMALLSGCSDNKLAYPDSYLLYSKDLPEGTQIATPPSDFKQFGIESYPTQVPAALLDYLEQQAPGMKPDVAWLEEIERKDGNGGMMVVAMFWNDAKKVDEAEGKVSTFRQQLCSNQDSESGSGRVLRDGSVIVVIGGDSSMREHVDPSIKTLQGKAPGLKDLCA